MDALSVRLRLQILGRPGPWIAVVEGVAVQRIREVIHGIGQAARGVEVRPGGPVPREDPPPRQGRWVIAGVPSTEIGPSSRWLACWIREAQRPIPGDPRAWRALIGEDLDALDQGIEWLLSRGWWLDARPFVARFRDRAYREASITWEDRRALRRVVRAEKHAARLADALGQPDEAQIARWAAAWVESELQKG